jgi:hypothetical protein
MSASKLLHLLDVVGFGAFVVAFWKVVALAAIA